MKNTIKLFLTGILILALLSLNLRANDLATGVAHGVNHLKDVAQVLAIKCGSQEQKEQRFQYYEAKTREFLKYLGCADADTIAIFPMEKEDSCYTWADGICTPHGMLLKMDKISSPAEMLFLCAHEASHHACRHVQLNSTEKIANKLLFGKLRKIRDFLHNYTLDQEREADRTAAKMLCENGYGWVVEEVSHVRHNSALLGFQNIKDHPSFQEQSQFLSDIVKKTHTHSSVAYKTGKYGLEAIAAAALGIVIGAAITQGIKQCSNITKVLGNIVREEEPEDTESNSSVT